MKKGIQYIAMLLALSNHVAGQVKLLDSLAFQNTVYGIDVSDDQQKLFIAGKDSTVYISSIDGEITHVLKGHSSSVSSVDFFEGKKTILSGSYDNSAILWDESGKEMVRLIGHENAVIKVAQSENMLATASRDNTVKVWNRQGKVIFTLNHTQQVNDLMFVKDKRWIITASFDKSIKIWDYNGNLIQSIPLASGIRSVAFSKKKELLLAGHRDGSISLVKPNGEIVQVIRAHGINGEEYKMVNSLAVSQDGSYFISGAADGFVKVWDLDGQLLEERKISDVQNAYVSGVRLAENSLITSSGGGDNYVRVWQVGELNKMIRYTCANANYEFLSQALGQWDVETKDRIRPGEYESNSGKAIIQPSIEGCGITISYRGTYKSRPYAREVNITGQESSVQMVTLDSEHGTYSLLEGYVDNGVLEVTWFRNKEVGKLRSKYVMTFIDQDTFEFSSFLSTDYSETWTLTHERIYTRIK